MHLSINNIDSIVINPDYIVIKKVTDISISDYLIIRFISPRTRMSETDWIKPVTWMRSITL